MSIIRTIIQPIIGINRNIKPNIHNTQIANRNKNLPLIKAIIGAKKGIKKQSKNIIIDVFSVLTFTDTVCCFFSAFQLLLLLVFSLLILGVSTIFSVVFI
jgi:hypothetical protein